MSLSPDTQKPAAGPAIEGQHATGQVGIDDNASRTLGLCRPDIKATQNFLHLIDPTANEFCFRTFNDAADVTHDHGRKLHGRLADKASALEIDNRARRGGTITAARNGQCTTLSALQKYDGLPQHLRTHKARARFWTALARLERVNRIVAEEYKNDDRKPRTRWAIPAGRAR